MPFQFLCPQGHLLEGIESQMGQQCQCPVCGTAFIVPVIGGPPAAQPAYPPPGHAAPGYAPAPPAYQPPPAYAPPPTEPPAAPSAAVLPDLNVGPAISAPADVAPPAIIDKPSEGSEQPAVPVVEPQDPQADPNRIVRIPCPKGHELHTPMSMIGMDAMCPECGEQFNLRYEDSIEAKEEREQRQQEREERMNKIILRTAIGAAVVVGLAILTMILLKAFSGSGEQESPSPATPSAPVEGQGPS